MTPKYKLYRFEARFEDLEPGTAVAVYIEGGDSPTLDGSDLNLGRTIVGLGGTVDMQFITTANLPKVGEKYGAFAVVYESSDWTATRATPEDGEEGDYDLHYADDVGITDLGGWPL